MSQGGIPDGGVQHIERIFCKTNQKMLVRQFFGVICEVFPPTKAL